MSDAQLQRIIDRQGEQIDKINDNMTLMAVSVAEMSGALKTFIEDSKENKSIISSQAKDITQLKIDVVEVKGEVSKNKALNVLRWTAVVSIGGFLLLSAKDILTKILT